MEALGVNCDLADVFGDGPYFVLKQGNMALCSLQKRFVSVGLDTLLRDGQFLLLLPDSYLL